MGVFKGGYKPMLFTENDLNYINGLALLDEATYLSEDESIINPATIPVKEVSRLGYGVVRFDDVDKLSEAYDIDYIDAMYAIAEASDMDPESLAVSVPEEDIIAYPEIVNELANIVVQPLSEYDPEYQFVTECVEAFLETGDEDYLEYIILEDDDPFAWIYGLEPGLDYSQNFTHKVNTVAPDGYHASKRLNKHHALVRARKAARAAKQPAPGKFFPEVPESSPNISLTRPGKKVHHEKPSMFQRVKAAPGAFVGAMKGYGNILSGKTQISTGEGKNEKNLTKWQMLKQHAAANKGSTAVAAGLGAAAIGGGIYAYKQYKNKPKSVIGKRIAALRGIYKNFMQQAQNNPQKAGMLKSIAAKILSVIDKLMGYLQNAAG